MSEEIQAAIRILELTTQTGIQIFKLGRECSISAMKRLKDLEHAKILSKAGQMDYETLIGHVGTDTVILNFHTEDRAQLDTIRQGFTDYKVSFVELPDLVSGDGYTQFMVDASDAAKIKGYLSSHPDLAFEPISADSYTAMGEESTWKKIHDRAEENREKEKALIPDEARDKKRAGWIRKTKKQTAKSKDLLPEEQTAPTIKEEKISIPIESENSIPVSFSPDQLMAETKRDYLFSLPGLSEWIAVPRQQVQKRDDGYLAHILPGRKYLRFAGKEVEQGTDAVLEHAVMDFEKLPDLPGSVIAQRMLKDAATVVKETANTINRELAADPHSIPEHIQSERSL